MKTFFTSDQHFGHSNILKFEAGNRVDERGVVFETVEQMDEFLIRQWNDVADADDLVYCLGDTSYKQETLRRIIPRLNGRKVLIVGNHDPYFERMTSGDKRAIDHARQRAQEAGFEAIYNELVIEAEGIGRVKLNHYPYAPLADGDELFAKYLHLRPEPSGEVLLIHGHIHSQWLSKQQQGQPLMVNVGVDAWGLRPVSIEDLKGLV